MAGPASRNMPTISSSTLMKNSSSSGSLVMEKKKLDRWTGTCERLAMAAKAVAVPMISRIAPEVTAAWRNRSGRSRNFRVRSTMRLMNSA